RDPPTGRGDAVTATRGEATAMDPHDTERPARPPRTMFAFWNGSPVTARSTHTRARAHAGGERSVARSLHRPRPIALGALACAPYAAADVPAPCAPPPPALRRRPRRARRHRNARRPLRLPGAGNLGLPQPRDGQGGRHDPRR